MALERKLSFVTTLAGQYLLKYAVVSFGINTASGQVIKSLISFFEGHDMHKAQHHQHVHLATNRRESRPGNTGR